MEQYIHIKSKYDCLVSINGAKVYPISNQKQLDIFLRKNCYVSIMPQHDDFLPYTFGTATMKNNENITIINHNIHTEIYFTPTLKNVQTNQTTLVDKKINNCYIKVSVSKNTFVSITTPDTSISRVLPPMQNCKCEYSEKLLLFGTLQNNEIYTLIYDIKKGNIEVEQTMETIEKQQNKIKMLANTKNISHHGIVYEYDTKSGDIDKYSVYIDKNPHRTTLKQAVPYAFIESVKLRDFNLARSYLIDTFVTNEQLENYFGQIDDIFPNPYSIDLEYAILSGDKVHNYKFELTENKIKDIIQLG